MTEEIQKNKDNSQGLLFVDRIMDTVDVFAARLSSGKFLFTLATAGVFVYASVSRVLTSEQTMAIIMLVVGFYFNKTETGQETKTTETKTVSETKNP
jgi:hypothetical protein